MVYCTKLSSHNTGSAIDVTLVDLYGNECEMPTKMIDLSVKALKYYSSTCDKNQNNYAETMTESAKKLDEYLTKSGMNTLASE